jgi:hypothetical protein
MNLDNLNKIDNYINEKEAYIRTYFKNYKVLKIVDKPYHLSLQERKASGTIYKKTGQEWYNYSNEIIQVKFTLQNPNKDYLILYNTYKDFKGYVIWVKDDMTWQLYDLRNWKGVRYDSYDQFGDKDYYYVKTKDSFNNIFCTTEYKTISLKEYDKEVESSSYKLSFNKFHLRPVGCGQKQRSGKVFELLYKDGEIYGRVWKDEKSYLNHYYSDKKEMKNVGIQLVRNANLFDRIIHHEKIRKLPKSHKTWAFISDNPDMEKYIKSYSHQFFTILSTCIFFNEASASCNHVNNIDNTSSMNKYINNILYKYNLLYYYLHGYTNKFVKVDNSKITIENSQLEVNDELTTDQNERLMKIREDYEGNRVNRF